MKSTGRSTINH